MKSLISLPVFMALIFASTYSSSALVTIEPDDYADGTNITAAHSGVWLRAISQNFELHSSQEGTFVGDVYAVQSTPCFAGDDCDKPYVAPTGEKVFGWRSLEGNPGHSWNGIEDYYSMEDFPDWAPTAGFMSLMVSFQQPTDYVNVMGAILSDGTMMAAYDIAGNQLEVSYEAFNQERNLCCAFPERGPYSSYGTSIKRDTRDIAYIVVGGESASVYLDHFTYSVPEPVSTLLFGTGLLALALCLRSLFNRRNQEVLHATSPLS